MAKTHELTPEQEAGWREWVEALPPVPREVARRFRPNVLYRLSSSGHRCTIASFGDNGTITVNITGEYNRITFGRQVFGIKPEDLTECDLPAPGEDVGDTDAEAGYNDEDVRTILIPKMRDAMGIATVIQDGREFYAKGKGLIFTATKRVPDGDMEAAAEARREFETHMRAANKQWFYEGSV